MKFLLRPGWIALVLLIVVFSALCFTLLAPWQFGRNQETETRNAAIAASLHSAPRPLSSVLPTDRTPVQPAEWTQVTFHGHYLPAGETMAWQRTVQGEAAFEVLTPFELDSGGTVLVDRGYVRPVDATHAPAFDPPPTGPVTVTARVRADEVDSDHRPTFSHDGHRWSYAINSATVAAGSGIAMRPGYFMLTEGAPGVLSPLPLPQLDSGPFFSYALQWIAFGVMAPLAVGYLIYSEIMLRRKPGEAETDGETPTPLRRRKMSVQQAIAEEERREREEAASNNG